jgi:hypothetical protein
MGVWMALLVSSGAVETRPVSVLVMSIEPRGGASKDLAEMLTLSIAESAGRIPGYRVVMLREVEGALSQEQVRQMASCDAVGCALEIAGAVNTDEIILGTLGRVGESHVLALSRVSARSALAEARVMERVPNLREDALLDVLPSVVAKLFARPPPTAAAEPKAAPARGFRKGWVAVGAGALLAPLPLLLLGVAGGLAFTFVSLKYIPLPWVKSFPVRMGLLLSPSAVAVAGAVLVAGAALASMGVAGVLFARGV